MSSTERIYVHRTTAKQILVVEVMIVTSYTGS
jgi:hypothetical protein